MHIYDKNVIDFIAKELVGATDSQFSAFYFYFFPFLNYFFAGAHPVEMLHVYQIDAFDVLSIPFAAYEQSKMGRSITADHGMKLLGGGGDRGGGGGHGSGDYGGGRRGIRGIRGGGRRGPHPGSRGGIVAGQRPRNEASKNRGRPLTLALTSIALCAALVQSLRTSNLILRFNNG